MESVFHEIALIICFAAGLSIVFRFLKQPTILAYILTGIIISAFHILPEKNHLTLHSLGELGVTFLLFMLGLELKMRELKSIGIPALVIGTLQMWFTFVLGFFLALALGFDKMPSIYLGIAVCFSSTILIVKNLSDKKDLNSLQGKLSIGILLMQDFFAVLALVLLSGIKPGEGAETLLLTIAVVLLKATVLVGSVILASITIIPKIVHYIARSSESLFLFALAWVFALTTIVTAPFIGFSIEIGGFLAGLALANCAENYQIVAKMKALRDFFITIFYVMLGLSMSFADFGSVIVPAIIFFLFAAIIKPYVIMLLVGQYGYGKRTAFLVGNNMGQVSEFSFILLFLGQKMGYIQNNTVTMMLLAGILGFLSSSYLMKHANVLYEKLGKFLFFVETEQSRRKQKAALEELRNHLVIVGGHQMGQSIINAMEDSKEKIIVVDFDPDVVKRLSKVGIPVIFGDIADPEIHERVHLDKAKLVISTIPDVEDNLLLVQSINHTNKKATVIVSALENGDARALYKAGADYVVLPHLAGGRYLARMIKEAHLETVEWHKTRDLAYIS